MCAMSPRLLRPRASGFDPRTLGNLVLWYDAADASTLFQNANGTTASSSNNDPVGFWRDKSIEGRNATQSTAGSRPTISSTTRNSRRLVNVASQGMTFSSFSLAGDYTFLYVCEPTNGNQFVLGGASGTHLPHITGFAPLPAFYNYSGSFGAISTSQSETGFRFVVVGRTSGDHFAFLNGTNVSLSPAASNSTTATLASLFFRDSATTTSADGIYGEILLFSKSLTALERTAMTSYLTIKWNL
jgi:hypothetical protein